MAEVTRRPLRVGPSVPGRPDDDAAIDMADDPSAFAQMFGDDRWSLHDADDRDHWALAGEPRRSPGGARIVEVVVAGWRFELEVEDAARAALRERATRSADAASHGGPLELRAIIPGRIMVVSVAAGDSVVIGQQLLVVEAMKMQNELRTPRAGTIARLVTSVGATVDLGDLLVVID